MFFRFFYLLLLPMILFADTVVFTCDFNNESVGTYSASQLKAAWGTIKWSNGVDEGRVSIVDESGNKVLAVAYPKAGVGPGEGGAQWEMDLVTLYDTLWATYKIKFPETFTFVRGGKLPGIGGGTTPTGGEDCTGEDGFSARLMWRWKNTADGEQGAMCQYVYHMDKPSTYGEDLYWAYPNYGWSSSRRYFVPGQWHEVKTRVIMNTPGQFDGRITSWLDGDLALDSLLRFRAEGVTHFANDKFLFSTFFGGSDSTWAPVKDEVVYFDDFVLSTVDPNSTNTLAPFKQHRPATIVRGAQSLLVEYAPKGLEHRFSVVDTRGRVVHEQLNSKGSFYWDFSAMAPGLYLLSLDGKFLQKVEIP